MTAEGPCTASSVPGTCAEANFSGYSAAQVRRIHIRLKSCAIQLAVAHFLFATAISLPESLQFVHICSHALETLPDATRGIDTSKNSWVRICFASMHLMTPPRTCRKLEVAEVLSSDTSSSMRLRPNPPGGRTGTSSHLVQAASSLLQANAQRLAGALSGKLGSLAECQGPYRRPAFPKRR